jgi:hypothetical protein
MTFSKTSHKIFPENPAKPENQKLENLTNLQKARLTRGSSSKPDCASNAWIHFKA